MSALPPLATLPRVRPGGTSPGAADRAALPDQHAPAAGPALAWAAWVPAGRGHRRGQGKFRRLGAGRQRSSSACSTPPAARNAIAWLPACSERRLARLPARRRGRPGVCLRAHGRGPPARPPVQPGQAAARPWAGGGRPATATRGPRPRDDRRWRPQSCRVPPARTTIPHLPDLRDNAARSPSRHACLSPLRRPHRPGRPPAPTSRAIARCSTRPTCAA